MISNIKALISACREFNLPYAEHDKDGNLVSVRIGKKVLYFHSHTTPLNSQTVSLICKDKEFTYDILREVVRMPVTKGYLDPNVSKIYDKYKRFNSIDEIVKDIENQFKYPLIIKRNRGSVGNNVFVANNVIELKLNLTEIFNKKNLHYDYVALVQNKVDQNREFRVTILNKKIELVYEKNLDNAKFTGNLSPLHWDGAKAIKIDDISLIKKLQKFIDPIFDELELNYGGLDIIEAKDGNLWLIELNSAPGYDHYVKDNGIKDIEILYKKIISSISLL